MMMMMMVMMCRESSCAEAGRGLGKQRPSGSELACGVGQPEHARKKNGQAHGQGNAAHGAMGVGEQVLCLIFEAAASLLVHLAAWQTRARRPAAGR